MRGVFVRLATGFALVAAAAVLAAERPAHVGAGRAYNVLLISLDTLRAGHVHCYGYGRDTSPNLDKLAEEGVLFENVTAASSWTVPSHMSLFTSLYPSVHGVEDTKKRLGEGVPTMAEILSKHAYTSAAFVTGPSLNHAMGFHRGFGLYDDFTVALMHETNVLDDLDVTKPGVNQVPTNHVVTKLASAWLKNHAGKKFFLFVHYWDCHNDYIPPVPYERKFDPDYKGAVTGRGLDGARRSELERRASPEAKKHLIALYDGEVAHSDAHVGRLLQALGELKLSERTLVIVFSDHGEGFWEHGKLLHGYGLQEELVHVPLLMRLPKVLPAGLRVKGNASHVDVLPTALGLLGLPKPKVMHGVDLWGVCRGKGVIPSRPIFSELNIGACNTKAIRWGPYKMIQEVGKPVGPLLVVRDGKETEAATAGPEDDAMRRLQGELAAALRAGPSAATSPERLAKPSNPDEETLRLLRSLGYVQ